MKLNGNVKSGFLAKAGQVTMIFVFVGVLLTITRGVARLVSSGDRVNVARERLAEAKRTQEELREKLLDINSDYYREKTARDQLGLARPGETVIVLPDEELLRRLSPRLLEEENNKPADPNWKKWVKLFFEI